MIQGINTVTRRKLILSGTAARWLASCRITQAPSAAPHGRSAPCSPLHSNKLPGMVRQILLAQAPVLPELKRPEQGDDGT
jgi:hypothetical protein